MATDFRLVAHASQRHSDELAIRRPGNRLAERGLSDSGRSHQTENGPLELLHPRLHREILHDAFLHLLETVVIGFEHLFRLAEVAAGTGALLPRHVDEPVDVVAHDGGFGRHRRHHLELVQLRRGLGARLLRHAHGFDPLGEVLDLVRRLVHVAELLLNRLHLLVEVVLALALLHLPLHAAANTLLDLQEIDLLLDARHQMLQSFARVVNFENRLFLVDLHREVSGDRIGEPCRVLDVRQRSQDFRRGLLVELDVLLEVGKKGAGQGLDLAPVIGSRSQHRDARAEEGLPVLELVDARPLPSFDQNLHRAVGELQELQDGGDRPDSIDLLDRRIVLARVHLRDEQYPLVLLHRLLERLNRSIPAHEEGDHHVRIDNDIPQGKHGDHVEHLRRVFSR